MSNRVITPAALIVLGAVAGALLGVVLSGWLGPLLAAIAAIIPPTVVTIVLVWRDHQRDLAMRREIDEIAEIAKRVDPDSLENTLARLKALSMLSLSDRYR